MKKNREKTGEIYFKNKTYKKRNAGRKQTAKNIMIN